MVTTIEKARSHQDAEKALFCMLLMAPIIIFGIGLIQTPNLHEMYMKTANPMSIKVSIGFAWVTYIGAFAFLAYDYWSRRSDNEG